MGWVSPLYAEFRPDSPPDQTRPAQQNQARSASHSMQVLSSAPPPHLPLPGAARPLAFRAPPAPLIPGSFRPAVPRAQATSLFLNSQIVENRRGTHCMDVMQTSDSSHHGIVENSPYRILYARHAEGGKLGNSWYFSRKEIEEYSISRKDGIDLKKESYFRKAYCTFLQDFGMRLQVPQVTIATAIVFCHRFFLRQSHAKNDRQTIATVCMFLAGKVEETIRPLRDVVLLSYEIVNKKDPAALQRIRQMEVYEQQKELILLGERVVLVTLGFDLNIDHPYKPLVEAIGRFKVAQSALAQVAWNFVNDGLRTSLCLQFKPHQIAAGAIFMAAKFLKIKLPSGGEKVWWQEFDVTTRHLEEISNQILELYEQNIVGPPPLQGNDTDRSPASAPNQRAPGKAPTAHEPQASRQLSHQNVPGHHGYDHAHPEKQHPNQRTPRNEARGSVVNSNDGPKISSSMMDAMRKIDKDKVKAALEKRRKSKVDVPRKVDIMDDDDLIERELEHGVELAAEGEKIKQERRQSWPHPAHREGSLKAARMIENTEEGELSTDRQGHRSPDRNWNYDHGARDIKRLRS